MKQVKKKTGTSLFMQALLLLCLVFALTACGGKGNEESTTTEAATPAETRPETEAPAGTPSETPGEANTGTDAGTGAGETDGGQMSSERLTAVRDALAEAYGESYLPQMPLDAEMLESLYGLTPDMYDEALGEVPMISAQVDTLILVKAKEGRAADVQAALENYRTFQLEEGMNYPMNVPKIEASEVLVYGDYVCYLMLGTIDDSIEDEAEMLTAYKEQNEIGKAVLEQQFVAE